jgi:hypothetical protein
VEAAIVGDIVKFPASLEDNQEFIVDLCRYAESLMSEAAIRKKYRLADDVWEKLGSNDALVEKIEAEKIRRTRDGSTKREKAQQLITKAPGILDSIMTDPAASPRHRVDAIKTLDTFAANGPEGAPASDRFIIQINLGEDVLKFNKSIKPDVDDIDPENIDTAPQGLLAAIAAKKSQDGGNGEPI